MTSVRWPGRLRQGAAAAGALDRGRGRLRPGGGLEIALSCDLIVAGWSALVGLPEVSVGVIPGGGGTQLVTRRVGWSRAARLIFTAEKLPASRAHDLGLVDELVEDGTARDHALALAHTIAANSPVGLRQAKRAMREGFDTDLSSGLDVEDAAWHATAFSGDRARGSPPSPRRDHPAGLVAEPGGPAYHAGMTRVLLAEDDPAISEPLARALRREGYDVDVHEDGQSALDAAQMSPDLVVLDLGLPRLDGLEVCRRLRSAGVSVPVLVLTARADEVDTVVGLDAGADDYVTKPFGSPSCSRGRGPCFAATSRRSSPAPRSCGSTRTGGAPGSRTRSSS